MAISLTLSPDTHTNTTYGQKDNRNSLKRLFPGSSMSLFFMYTYQVWMFVLRFLDHPTRHTMIALNSKGAVPRGPYLLFSLVLCSGSIPVAGRIPMDEHWMVGARLAMPLDGGPLPHGYTPIPCGKSLAPHGSTVHPTGRASFPSGKGARTCGKGIIPLGGEHDPLGLGAFPGGSALAPSGTVIATTGKGPVPGGRITCPPGRTGSPCWEVAPTKCLCNRHGCRGPPATDPPPEPSAAHFPARRRP